MTKAHTKRSRKGTVLARQKADDMREQCPTHKRAWKSKALAKQATIGDPRGPIFRPFRCELCGRWHLTTKPLRKPGKGRTA